MMPFQHTVSLPVAQLVTLLLLARNMKPEEDVESRFKRATCHLLGQEMYVAEGETRCPHTGQLVRHRPRPRRRSAAKKAPTSLGQISSEGAMLDHVARVVVDLGVGSHPDWTWWDAEVVATLSDGRQWLIQRVRTGARFGRRSEPDQGGYLYGKDDGGPWVLTVPAHIRNMQQAQAALARARAVEP